LRQTVTAINAKAKRVTTDKGARQADFLVIAPGADCDVSSTSGIVLGENECYSVPGAKHAATILPGYQGGDLVVAVFLVSHLWSERQTARNPGAGPCHIGFGADRIVRVGVDFLSGPKPFGTFHGTIVALRHDKEQFGTSRRTRWFGL
jgi:hypothetical protein